MRIVTVILIGVCGIYLGLRLIEGEPTIVRKAAASQASPASSPPRRWYKGNTHTHTLNSDGDSTPDDVVRWYRENRYNFLVLTDHNYLTGVDGLQALHGADEKFLVIRGEEVTDSFEGKPIHINGLNPSRLITPQGGRSVLEVIQRNVDEIRAALAVPHINHPNFGWAIVADELRQARNYRLFEIYNGHPTVNNLGGGDSPGLEQMWDYLLHQGQQLYGLAVDDAHVFKRPWDTTAARPGRGWIYVRAERLAPEPLLAALERGDFYASTGVELADYQADARSIKITIKEEKSSKYRIQFIGRGANPWDGGRILKEATTLSAVYEIRGDEGYVRAKILESNGKAAWTQPVMVTKQ
jgi:predicted metal-dependent phosphoesterase TrpH